MDNILCNFFIFLCVYALCVWLFLCWSVHAHAHTGTLIYHSVPCSLVTGSLPEPGARLAAGKSRDPSVSPPHNAGVKGAFTATSSVLHGFWGFELRSSYSKSKCSYPPRHVHRFYCWTDRHSYCFHIWAAINSAAITICVQICVWLYIFISLGCKPRSGISGSCDNSGPPACFPKWLRQFLSHQQQMRGPVFYLDSICCYPTTNAS